MPTWTFDWSLQGLVVAPNLEVSTAEGGLDDTVEDLIELARENEVQGCLQYLLSAKIWKKDEKSVFVANDDS